MAIDWAKVDEMTLALLHLTTNTSGSTRSREPATPERTSCE